MTSPGQPPGPAAGKPGQAGKRRGLILAGAAAAVVGVIALTRRGSPAAAAATPQAITFPGGPAGDTGGNVTGLEAQMAALQDSLLSQERQIDRLQRHPKKKRKKKPPRRHRRHRRPTPPPHGHGNLPAMTVPRASTPARRPRARR